MCNMYMNYAKPECPECESADVEILSVETQENFDHPITDTVFVCHECGHEFVIRHIS